MKKFIAMLIMTAFGGGLLTAAGEQAQATNKKTKKAAAPKAAPRVEPVTIPKDAVPLPGGSFSYTDKNGKKWIYTNTPFGVSRVEDMGPPPAAGVDPNTKAIDKGDVVRFERPSPFGTMTWEKKKTELTDEERQMVEAQNPNNNPGSHAEETQTAKPDAGPGK
jgi:hypothetical protein